jgi:membrane-bound serine protease (ClpP class)
LWTIWGILKGMKAKPLATLLFALLVFPMVGKSEVAVSNDWNRALVYQIPIENQIEPALLYVIRRGVAEATKAKADAIIFTMNTPGGRVDVTRDILEIIREINVPVYTFVEQDAYSAGAIIALSTPHIYMAPGSVIGAATPILMGPGGGVQDLNEDVGEKMKSGVAAMVRAAAEQGGHSTELAEAMVRREIEYKIGTNVISKAGELLTLTNSEAEGILSEGTVDDLNALLEAIGLSGAEIKKLEVSPAEKLARVISAIAPFLLMIGLGGIYLEIKTPGFGLPGIAGAAALVLFFFGHHIAGLAGMEDVVIFIIGFALLFAEVFITPGFGVLGISGIVLILVSLLNAMSWQVPGEILPVFSGAGATIQRAITNLALGMLGTVVIGAAAGRFLPKSRVVRPLVLSQSTDKASGFSAAHDHSELLGKEGIAEMNLHPAGRAIVDGERVNVITRGEFIAKNSAVKIVEAKGSRIVVEAG